MKEIRIRQMPSSPIAIDGRTLSGYAIVYNSDSLDLGGYTERFLPGSVTDTIKSNLIEAWTYHDRTKPLGSQAAGTLRLKDDQYGLGYEIDLPETSYANDLRAMMSDGRKDVGGTSFGFWPQAENWVRRNDGSISCEVVTAGMDHISPVITPAYPATSALLRSLDQSGIDAKALYGVDINSLGQIFLAANRGLELTADETQIARDVISRLRSLVRSPKLEAAIDQANRILL